jgi:hypothetical protein
MRLEHNGSPVTSIWQHRDAIRRGCSTLEADLNVTLTAAAARISAAVMSRADPANSAQRGRGILSAHPQSSAATPEQGSHWRSRISWNFPDCLHCGKLLSTYQCARLDSTLKRIEQCYFDTLMF